jgi:hypothetical protein
MSNKSTAIVATMGIDIGKNSFHVVGLDQRGAIFPSESRREGRRREIVSPLDAPFRQEA